MTITQQILIWVGRMQSCRFLPNIFEDLKLKNQLLVVWLNTCNMKQERERKEKEGERRREIYGYVGALDQYGSYMVLGTIGCAWEEERERGWREKREGEGGRKGERRKKKMKKRREEKDGGCRGDEFVWSHSYGHTSIIYVCLPNW